MFLSFSIRACQHQPDFLCQPADDTHRVVGETRRVRPIYRQHAEEIAAHEHRRTRTGPELPCGRQLAYIQGGIRVADRTAVGRDPARHAVTDMYVREGRPVMQGGGGMHDAQRVAGGIDGIQTGLGCGDPCQVIIEERAHSSWDGRSARRRVVGVALGAPIARPSHQTGDQRAPRLGPVAVGRVVASERRTAAISGPVVVV